MNKTELIAAVAEDVGVGKKDTEQVLNAFFSTVQETLKLTRSEVRAITQFERGEALICSNSNKVPVVIKASQTELEMITTDQAELEALLMEKKKARKEEKTHKSPKTQKKEVETSPSSLPDYTSDSKKGRK